MSWSYQGQFVSDSFVTTVLPGPLTYIFLNAENLKIHTKRWTYSLRGYVKFQMQLISTNNSKSKLLISCNVTCCLMKIIIADSLVFVYLIHTQNALDCLLIFQCFFNVCVCVCVCLCAHMHQELNSHPALTRQIPCYCVTSPAHLVS